MTPIPPPRPAARALRFPPSVRRHALALMGGLAIFSSALGGVFYPEGATTLHFAFEGSPDGDRPIVRPPATFHPEDGFGFVASPGLRGTARGVTAPKYFRFDVNLPAGTYDITVRLGGASVPSITRVKAENHVVLEEIALTSGESVVKTVTVSVTHGAPGKGTPEGDGRLNLEFEGTNPSLMKLDIKPSGKPSG